MHNGITNGSQDFLLKYVKCANTPSQDIILIGFMFRSVGRFPLTVRNPNGKFLYMLSGCS